MIIIPIINERCILYYAFIAVFLHMSGFCIVFKNICELPQSKPGSTGLAISLKNILYDVNFPEGFNLRRDVYIRLAVWIKKMQDKGNPWKLVLPPWNRLYHWRSKNAGIQQYLPWSLFFDISSFQSYVTVSEMYSFFEENQNRHIDNVIILQHYKDSFSEGFKWKHNWDIENCSKPHHYIEVDNGSYMGTFLGYNNITASNIHCVSFCGHASLLEEIINYFDKQSILFEHAEVVLHDQFGDAEYWNCRKSMKFSSDLISIANDFIFNTLNVTRVNSGINVNDKYYHGYPYLCSHLRRVDYLLAYPKEVPSIKWAAYQLHVALQNTNLSTIFIATDGFAEEFDELKHHLSAYNVVKFVPPVEIIHKYKDGGVAIIDQIICSYARYFIGSHYSTYSFRIQEEREILGFDPATTFNRLCGDNMTDCSQPTKWRIVT